jgi:3-phenylpropionate/cinnamic acid dioxygenase small subunit
VPPLAAVTLRLTQCIGPTRLAPNRHDHFAIGSQPAQLAVSFVVLIIPRRGRSVANGCTPPVAQGVGVTHGHRGGDPIVLRLLSAREGYLKDRLVAIRQTAVYGPRYMRRLVSNIRILGWKDGWLEVRATYAAFETPRDELTRVFSVGRCHDKLVVADGRLKFKEKLVIFDSELIPNSLIYPL